MDLLARFRIPTETLAGEIQGIHLRMMRAKSHSSKVALRMAFQFMQTNSIAGIMNANDVIRTTRGQQTPGTPVSVRWMGGSKCVAFRSLAVLKLFDPLVALLRRG